MKDEDPFEDLFDDDTGLEDAGAEVDDIVEVGDSDLVIDESSPDVQRSLDEIDTEEIDTVDLGDQGSDLDLPGIESDPGYQEFDPTDYSPSPYGAFALGMMFGEPVVQGTSFGGSLKARTSGGVVEAEEYRGGDAVEITYTGKFADTEFSYLDTARHTDFGDVTVEDGEVVSQGFPMRSMDLSDLDSASEAYKMVVDDAEDAREIARNFDGRMDLLSESVSRFADEEDGSYVSAMDYDDFLKG